MQLLRKLEVHVAAAEPTGTPLTQHYAVTCWVHPSNIARLHTAHRVWTMDVNTMGPRNVSCARAVLRRCRSSPITVLQLMRIAADCALRQSAYTEVCQAHSMPGIHQRENTRISRCRALFASKYDQRPSLPHASSTPRPDTKVATEVHKQRSDHCRHTGATKWELPIWRPRSKDRVYADRIRLP